ncbi:hypothetical protein M876_01280 [Elizabethkingia anophelis FMS-007]|nr:hypothetical protein M876_01280 [Elizabethkingia anophelis FMS-007]
MNDIKDKKGKEQSFPFLLNFYKVWNLVKALVKKNIAK